MFRDFRETNMTCGVFFFSFLYLLELGSQFNRWVRGVSSSTVSGDEAIDEGVEITVDD